MTALRRRMIECLQLRGLSERTQDRYVRAVRHLAAHYRKSPDVITEEDLRHYFRYLKNVKQYSRRASTMALCGLTFFFAQTLHRDWTTLRFVRAPREHKLPVLLSLEEVRKLLGCVRLPRDRVCLTTIDSWGLRLQEGTDLQGPDMDSARLLIHVRHGKGGKDRYVPLPQQTLERRRQDWVTHRHPLLLFPAAGRGGISLSTATAPMPRSRVQGAVREALKERGSPKHASVPTLRHSWATHVLAAGVKLRLLPVDRGPTSPTTTSVYPPLTARAEPLGADAINRLMRDLCWWRALTASAGMAPSTARTVAAGGFPGLCGPCRTLNGAARRRAAARSSTVRAAERTMTATPPVRTGTVPRANRTRLSQGSTPKNACCCRSLTAGSPSRVLMNSKSWPAAPRRPATTSAFGAHQRPYRHWRWLSGASAAGSGW